MYRRNSHRCQRTPPERSPSTVSLLNPKKERELRQLGKQDTESISALTYHNSHYQPENSMKRESGREKDIGSRQKNEVDDQVSEQRLEKKNLDPTGPSRTSLPIPNWTVLTPLFGFSFLQKMQHMPPELSLLFPTISASAGRSLCILIKLNAL